MACKLGGKMFLFVLHDLFRADNFVCSFFGVEKVLSVNGIALIVTIYFINKMTCN